MKNASSGINATMGTLSGAEQISQSCRQSIVSPRTMWGRPLSAEQSLIPSKPLTKTLRAAFDGQPKPTVPTENVLLSGCLRSAARLVSLFGQHDRSWTRDAAVFPYAPKVDNHQHRRHNRNADAVPYIGPQQ